MNFSQSFRLALKSLMVSKMRAILTMLGIIIGVAAVIIITSMGNGMQNLLNEQFDQLGANLIQVQVYGRGGGSRTIEPDDMYELVDKYPQYLAGVSPYVPAQGIPVRKGSDEFKKTSLYGVSEAFYDASRNQTITGEKLAEGRFLSYIDVERYQNNCVIGDYLNQEMFQGDALGKTLTVGGVPYTVVGVLQAKADSTEGSGDDQIFLPYGNAMRLNTAGQVSAYLFTSTNKDTSTAAKGIIENRLFKTFQSSDYYFVMSSAEMMDAMNTMMDTMVVVLVAIAAISLLVGGIGIMNIMLVSVTERTREIGIRKSLGGKRRDIRSQFIIEAGTTSAIGGVIGIVVGVLLAQVASAIIGALMGSTSEFHAIPTVGSVAVAFGVSVAVGVAFGYLPANKAAKLNPIDALRYD
jgi:putative ABC transport system permease protein